MIKVYPWIILQQIVKNMESPRQSEYEYDTVEYWKKQAKHYEQK